MNSGTSPEMGTPTALNQGVPSQGTPTQGMPSDPKAALQELMAAVDEKMAGVNQKASVGQDMDQQAKVEILQVLFDVLQRNGIDPNDQEAVNAFLEQLKQASPEVYNAFETALNNILDTFGGETPEGVPGQNPAEAFPNLGASQQGMLQEEQGQTPPVGMVG